MSQIVLQAQERGIVTFNPVTATTTTGTAEAAVLPYMPWNHTVQVVVSGSPTTVTAQLFGSLDGTNFFSLNTAQTVTSGGIFSVANVPVLQVKVVVVITGAATVTVTYGGIR